MNAPLCLLLLSLASVHVTAADRSGGPVDLSSPSSPRSGVQQRE